MKRIDLEEAIQLAEDIIGYPCPCERCSTDGGRAKSIEIMDLAYDLVRIIPLDLISWPRSSTARMRFL